MQDLNIPGIGLVQGAVSEPDSHSVGGVSRQLAALYSLLASHNYSGKISGCRPSVITGCA